MEADRAREKVASLFRKLIDVVVLDQGLAYSLEQYVWPSISQDELLLEIFLDELVKAALNYGSRQEVLDKFSTLLAALGTITLRGKLITRLRKTLNRSSLRPTRCLPDNAVWEEICVLLRFTLATSFDSRVQSQMYLPEILHLTTMLVGTGNHDIQMLVYKFLINSIHAICTSFRLEEAKHLRLRAILDVLSDSRADIFLPSSEPTPNSASKSPLLGISSTLRATENLTAIGFEVCSVAAPCMDIANAWRARWMSLIASTAFQNNPAIQPRAFSVMGHLAEEEVDDDLLYQVLVALRNSVSQFREDGNYQMLVSIISSLSKMMPKLPSTSRYGLQMFWLAISLLRLVPTDLFSVAAQLLQAILKNFGSIGVVQGSAMAYLLLQCRNQLIEAALPLDDAYGIHFEEETFHFAVCACLARGLTDTANKPTVKRVLSTLLELSTRSEPLPSSGRSHIIEGSPYLSLLVARMASQEDLIDCLWWADLTPESVSNISYCRGLPTQENTKDVDVVLILAVELVDFHYLEEAAQASSLRWLNLLAEKNPLIFDHL